MPQLSIAADIPADLIDADHALSRYGRWATTASGGAKRCGSAERMFRSEKWFAVELRRSAEYARATREPLMSTDEALICQRALARVPDLQRVVLTVLYIPRRLPAEAQLRILRIPPRLSQDRHLRGLRMFDNLRRVMTMETSAKPRLTKSTAGAAP